jgi:uncharacterized membrane protein
MDTLLWTLVCAGALGSAIVGGMFYAFSSFVMKALARIPPEQGVAAMNAINIVVINSSFMIVFAGTALVSVALVLLSYPLWPQASGQLIVLAALLYGIGTFGLTMRLHQPMNLRLAALAPYQARAYWPGYVQTWTRWNHVRTAAPLAASALLVAALVLRAAPAG